MRREEGGKIIMNLDRRRRAAGRKGIRRIHEFPPPRPAHLKSPNYMRGDSPIKEYSRNEFSPWHWLLESS